MSGTAQLTGSDGEPVNLTLPGGASPPVRRQLQWDDTPQTAAHNGGAGTLPTEVLVKRICYIFEQKQAERLERLPRMLDRNADANVRDPQTGDTPLHLAVANGHERSVWALLQKGQAQGKNLSETRHTKKFESFRCHAQTEGGSVPKSQMEL